MSLSSKPPLSFFDLPRELRDSIYHLLLQGISFSFRSKEIRFSKGLPIHFVYDGRKSRHSRRLPGWLFASKQFFEEGRKQWYCKVRCTYCYCDDRFHVPDRSFAATFCELNRVDNFDAPSWDTDGRYVGHLILDESPWTKRTARHQIIAPSIREDFPFGKDLVFNYLKRRTTHPAKQIRFRLEIPLMWPFKEVEEVNLSYFKELRPRFDLVRFQLACPIISELSDYRVEREQLPRVIRMYRKAQQEAVNVAMYLVGAEETKSWHVRDYLRSIPSGYGGRKPPSEWCLVAERRQFPPRGQLRYEGLQCFQSSQLSSDDVSDHFILSRNISPDGSRAWHSQTNSHVITLPP